MSLSNNSPKCGALAEVTEASKATFHKETYELLMIIILAGEPNYKSSLDIIGAKVNAHKYH
jgi:hypothetical protein